MMPENQTNAPSDSPAPPPLNLVALASDTDLCGVLSTILESSGHDLRTAGTPNEFFAACKDRVPEIALLDLSTGEVDGAGVLEQIQRSLPRMCVIVIAEPASLDSMREMLKHRVIGFLAKPLDVSELNHALAQAAGEIGLGQRPQDRLRAALGRQIRLARTERGWTLKELSEVSSVSVSQLSSIERGAHLPSIESLLSIAQALGTSPSEWLSAAGF